MADFSLADLSQRVARMIRFGNITTVQASPPRCRVTFGTDPVTNLPHESGWLRLAGIADDSMSTWRLPATGASVMVLSPGGEVNSGLVFPAGFTDDREPPSDKPEQYVTRFRDGAQIAYDAGQHEMQVSLPEGGRIIIVAASGVKITGDLDVDGEVRDKTGTMQEMRDTYDAHNHNENGDGGGVTDPPNQKMQSGEEPGE